MAPGLDVLLQQPEESGETSEGAVMPTRGIAPQSPKFTALILQPHRIVVNYTNALVPSAFHHFETKRPVGGYRAIKGLSGANIWITTDDVWMQCMTQEYNEMKALGLCEEEFAAVAKQQLLLQKLRSSSVFQDRQWRGERLLQLSCPPRENAPWRKPPVLDHTVNTDVDWTWDVRHDCAYWLSLRGFSPKYRSQIQNCVFVHGSITCPYLSIGFRRDGQSEDAVIAQVAAAGSMALFNRFKLRAEAVKANSNLGNDASIRHYALTFAGPRFVLWVLQPTYGNAWNGCTMKRLVGADCAHDYGIRELVDWINEIHRWALSRHGPSCERDIKAVASHEEGKR